MPRVSGNYVAQAQLDGLPGVQQGTRVNADELGASIGQAMQRGSVAIGQGAEDLQRYGQIVQDRTDRALVRDAVNADRTALLQKRQEFEGLQGKDGLDLLDRGQKYVDELRSQGQAKFANERLRDLYGQAMDSVGHEFLNWSASRQAHNSETFRNTTLDSEAGLLLQEGAGKFDQASVDDYSARIVANRRARFLHMGEEAATYQAGEAVQKLHEENLSQLINSGRTDDARVYLDKYRDRIGADKLPSLEKHVRDAEDHQLRLNVADEYSQMPLSAAYAAAQKDPRLEGRPDLRQTALSASEARANVLLTMQAQTDRAALENARGAVDAAIRAGNPDALSAALDKAPPLHHGALVAYASEMARGSAGRVTFPDVYNAAENAIYQGQPVDWTRTRPALADADYDRLLKLQGKLDDAKGMASLKEQFHSLVHGSNALAGVKPKEREAALNDLWVQTSNELDAAKLTTYKERRQFLDDKLKAVVLSRPGIFSNTEGVTVPAYRAPGIMQDSAGGVRGLLQGAMQPMGSDTRPPLSYFERKSLDEATARSILSEAGGDREKARQIAKQRGYSF